MKIVADIGEVPVTRNYKEAAILIGLFTLLKHLKPGAIRNMSPTVPFFQFLVIKQL